MEEKEKMATSTEWLYETIVECVKEFDGALLTERVYRAWVTLKQRDFDLEDPEKEKGFYDTFRNAWLNCNEGKFENARFSLAALGMQIFDIEWFSNEMSNEREY